MIRKLALTAISAAALTACDKVEETAAQASWAEDQASANLEEINSLRSRISDLESEIALMKSREDRDRDFLASTYNAHAALSRYHEENMRRLYSNDEAWRKHLNYLRSFHGAAPIPEPTSD